MDMKTIILLVIIAILGVLLGLKSCNKPTENSTKVTTETTTDISTRIDTVEGPAKSYPVRVPYNVYVPVPGDTVYVPLVYRGYRDTLELDSSLTVNYDLLVAGELREIKLGYLLKKPVTTITTTTTINTSSTVDNSNGLYVGGSLSSERLGVGASYLYKGHLIGYDYGVLSNGSQLSRHSISYHRKIW